MNLLDTAQRILTQAGVAADLHSFVVLFALCFARLAGVITQAPFFGGSSAPGQVKVGLAVILAAILYPSITPAGGLAHPLSAIHFAALLVKEGLLGVSIGLLSQLVFYAVQMSGTLIDSQRGANQMNFLAPQLAGPTSVLGQLQFQTALVIFLAIDGHLLFLRVLASSFNQLPILEMPRMQAGIVPIVEQIARISSDTFVTALRLCAPVLIALFLVDVSFGAIGRVAGQINVHNESQPIKAWTGLAVFLLASGLIFDNLPGIVAKSLASVFEMVRVVR